MQDVGQHQFWQIWLYFGQNLIPWCINSNIPHHPKHIIMCYVNIAAWIVLDFHQHILVVVSYLVYSVIHGCIGPPSHKYFQSQNCYFLKHLQHYSSLNVPECVHLTRKHINSQCQFYWNIVGKGKQKTCFVVQLIQQYGRRVSGDIRERSKERHVIIKTQG